MESEHRGAPFPLQRLIVFGVIGSDVTERQRDQPGHEGVDAGAPQVLPADRHRVGAATPA